MKKTLLALVLGSLAVVGLWVAWKRPWPSEDLLS